MKPCIVLSVTFRFFSMHYNAVLSLDMEGCCFVFKFQLLAPRPHVAISRVTTAGSNIFSRFWVFYNESVFTPITVWCTVVACNGCSEAVDGRWPRVTDGTFFRERLSIVKLSCAPIHICEQKSMSLRKAVSLRVEKESAALWNVALESRFLLEHTWLDTMHVLYSSTTCNPELTNLWPGEWST